MEFLGPLLFILYTTPLSTVIYNYTATNHLYADDTQLLLLFSAIDLSHNITHPENSWPIANVRRHPIGCLPTSSLLFILKLILSSLGRSASHLRLQVTIAY